MALIWSKMTTGMPFQIMSAQRGQSFRSEYTLDMDIHQNEPHVHAAAVRLSHNHALPKLKNPAISHGTAVLTCD